MKPPKGWYRLRTGAKVREHDHWYEPCSCRWFSCMNWPLTPVRKEETVIRKRARREKK
jgi:hypothetical protein